MIRPSYRLFFLLPLLVAACSNTPPEAPGPTRPSGLYAVPERLAFTCVSPGCDESTRVRVAVAGGRRVAVKRITLWGQAASDFTLELAEPAPFLLGSGSEFEIGVRYAPQGAPASGAVELRLAYTDGVAEESADRLAPAELVVPLVRRLVGEPLLRLEPGRLSFGAVDAGESASLPLEVWNRGSGNVALELAGVDAGSREVQVVLPPKVALRPDAGLTLPIAWSPSGEGYLSATLEVRAVGIGVLPETVALEGTSLSTPLLALEPSGEVDFGELPRGQSRRLEVRLHNRGGRELVISELSAMDAGSNVRLVLADGGLLPSDGGSAEPLRLSALDRVPLRLEVAGTTPGEVDASFVLATNEVGGPRQLSVRGTVTEPKLSAAPVALDFGTVPSGWVVRKPVELKNTGFGTLTVKDMRFVTGSSSLFTLFDKPALPLTLARGQRVAVEVELRAEAAAPFSGVLSVESDDAQTPFLEVPLSATVGSCDFGCPIANGSPDCSAGVCKVGTCTASYFDTDGQPANGCECKEEGVDPGGFCSTAANLGTLVDEDGDQRTFVGKLPAGDDVDVIRFFAKDEFSLGGDEFNVKVSLSSADPDISFCVYRSETSSPQSDCFWNNEDCPVNRSYEKDGSSGSGDDADFVVKVYRKGGSAPSCGSYSLFLSNGR